MFHINKEPHFTHRVTPVSSYAENSFGEWAHKLDNYNDKEIENLYIEDTKHKYDHNLLSFINKKKRQHNSISIPSPIQSDSQHQIKQHNYEDLVIGNYDHIEIIDGQIDMKLNVIYHNEEDNSRYIMNKNLEIEYKGDDKDEECFLTREVEIDYKGKKKMVMKSYVGGIHNGEFYYVEKEGVVLEENYNNNNNKEHNSEKEESGNSNDDICSGGVEDVEVLEELMKWKEGSGSWEEGNEGDDNMESEVVLLESMLKWKEEEKEGSVKRVSLSLCLLEEQMKWDGSWEEEEEEKEDERDGESNSEVKGNNNDGDDNSKEEINNKLRELEEQESTIGPETPKCVNNISPKSL